MIYTVTWAPDAEEELIRIWISSGSRNAVKKATDGIDKLLRLNPETKGEPFGNNRSLHVPPLLVVYEIIPDDCLVQIIQVVPETN